MLEGLFLDTNSFQLSKKTWSKYVNVNYAIACTRSPSKSFPELTDFASDGTKVRMLAVKNIELSMRNVGRSHLQEAGIELQLSRTIAIVQQILVKVHHLTNH